MRYTQGMTTETIGIGIRRERLIANLSIRALSRLVGCDEASIRRIEVGGQVPSVMLLDTILRTLGVRLTIGQADSRRLKLGRAA